MKHIQLILYFGAILLFSPWLTNAQITLDINPSSVNINISSQDRYKNGNSLDNPDYLTRRINFSTPARQVILNVNGSPDGFKNSSNTIPLSSVSIQVTAIDRITTGIRYSLAGAFAVFPLSTVPQNIIPGFFLKGSALGGDLKISIKYIVTGGADLLKPEGTYFASLHFMTSGDISQAEVNGTLSLNLVNISSIVLNSSAENASLKFESAADYKNGVTLPQSSAMEVFSNNPYKVSVRATDALKLNGNSILANNISLTPTANPPSSGIIPGIAVPLSTATQDILTSSQPTLSQFFDIEYSTAPGNPAFLNRDPGTYTTQLTYMLTSP